MANLIIPGNMTNWINDHKKDVYDSQPFIKDKWYKIRKWTDEPYYQELYIGSKIIDNELNHIFYAVQPIGGTDDYDVNGLHIINEKEISKFIKL